LDIHYDALCYGTVGIDIIVRVPQLPRPDLSTHSSDVQELLGGKATNTAVHLCAWGKQVAVSGTIIGDDPIGQRLIETVRKIPNLSTAYLEQRLNTSSMYCLILVEPGGERSILGINTDTVQYTTPTPELVGSARLLTLDLYGGAERVDAARIAKSLGIPVIVGDVRDADHPVIPYSTTVIASNAELQAQQCDSHTFADKVLSRGVETVFVTDASRAVHVFSSTGTWHLQPPISSVVDTTGAGDAFRAGVIYGWLESLPMPECGALGIASGANAVRHVGGSSNVPTTDTLEEVAASIMKTAKKF
jgi:sugar/nucleoside kinase (ribokinase family)